MKVITAVVNNPVFIEIQYYTLKKYMKCDYEFIVFNDAKGFPDFSNGENVHIKNEIENLCESLGIKCINIPNEQHMHNHCPVARCADSMNFILNYQIQHPDKYLLLDSDMFLIDDFYLTDYDEYKCAVVLQSRKHYNINYVWNGLYYFDFNILPNIELLNWSNKPGCDVGGMMEQWLTTQTRNIPNTDEIRHSDETFCIDNIYYIKHLWSCTWDESEMPENIKNNDKLCAFIKSDPRNRNGKFYCEIYDKKFLHYRAGGNWERRGMNIHIELSSKLREILLN